MARAVLIGLWIALLMTLSAVLAWAMHSLVLAPLELELLSTFVFVIIIGSLGIALEHLVSHLVPEVYEVLKSYGTFVTSNCAVLGIALIVLQADFTALDALLAGFAAGLGVLLAMVLLSALRERLNREAVPEVFRGAPIAFISAGLIAMSFLAFDSAFLSKVLG
jgi:electron transport complex protein RnfA